MNQKCFLTILFVISCCSVHAQILSGDSIHFDKRKIFSSCLNADVASALQLLKVDPSKKISAQDSVIKKNLEARFAFESDRSSYLTERQSSIDDLLKVYHEYWRNALLNSSVNHDEEIQNKMRSFLTNKFKLNKKDTLSPDRIDSLLNKYIASEGYHTTGFGKTGSLYDLLVWREEKDTIYKFSIHGEKIEARVILMDKFITLGWEEYATLDKLYPGGWATTEALYCVKKGYDLNSEDFLISYLAHEGRHFSDYKAFPKLESADLEYRGKLTELSLARETLYKIIDFFIANADSKSDNGHNFADYYVIHDLSEEIFQSDFEKDISRWEEVGPEKINLAAYKIFQRNTQLLQSKEPDVKSVLKSKGF
jgi:hypothetical protein